MKYEILPVVSDTELQEALELQFGPDIMGQNEFMANVLFGDDYNNDSCKYYSFKEDEVYEGKIWQKEEHILIRNCLNAMLRDMFPNYERILVDVTW